MTRRPLPTLALAVALVVPGFAAAPTTAAVEPVRPTITIASGQNPSLRGDRVSFTVTVNPAPPDGIVVVDYDFQAYHEDADPSGVNVLEVPFRQAGTFQVNACFHLSRVYADACTTSSVTQVVVAHDTTTTLQMTPLSLYEDEKLTVRAQVSPAPDTPISVHVRRGTTGTYWVIPLDLATGVGEVVTEGADLQLKLEPGANTFHALWGGSDHYNGSTSPTVTVNVKRDASTTTFGAHDGTVKPVGWQILEATIAPVPPPGSQVKFTVEGPVGPGNGPLNEGVTDGSGRVTTVMQPNQHWPLGTYTVRALFQGSSRLAPSQATTTVTLADTDPPYVHFLNDSFAWERSRSIAVRTQADGTGSKVVTAALSNNGTAWTEMPYASDLPWTLSAGDGTKEIWIRVRDAGGLWSPVRSTTLRLDTVTPTVTAPQNRFVVGTAVNGGFVPVRLAWSGVDAVSGIARYELRARTDGSAWFTQVASQPSTGATLNLAPGHTYRYAVRAWDQAGNVSEYAYGTTFALTGVSEASSAIAYRGTWGTASAAGFWGGRLRYATSPTARATFTFTGRSVGLVTTMSPSRGRAAIYVNGAFVQTVDLHAATWRNGVIAWSRTFATATPRTVELRVLGTPGRPRVDLDGWVVGS